MHNFPCLHKSLPQTERNYLQKLQCLEISFWGWQNQNQPPLICRSTNNTLQLPLEHRNIIFCCHSAPTSPLYLLEVNKSWFVCVQQESPSVGTDWVSADVWLRVFKLLFHIFYHCLTVQAQEGSTYKLRMNWVGTYHLSTDTHQRANFRRCQFSNSV